MFVLCFCEQWDFHIINPNREIMTQSLWWPPDHSIACAKEELLQVYAACVVVCVLYVSLRLRGLTSRRSLGSDGRSLSCSSFFWKGMSDVSRDSFWISVGGITMQQSMKSPTASVSSRSLWAWKAAWLNTCVWKTSVGRSRQKQFKLYIFKNLFSLFVTCNRA